MGENKEDCQLRFTLKILFYSSLCQLRSPLRREKGHVPEPLPASVVSGVLSYVRCKARERSSVASGPRFRLLFCSAAARRGARGGSGGAKARRPHVLFKAQAQAATCAAPRIYLPPPPPLLPSPPLITNMTDFTLSRLFPLSPQVATIEMSDTSD